MNEWNANVSEEATQGYLSAVAECGGRGVSAIAQHDQAQHDQAQHDQAQHDQAQHDQAQHDQAQHDQAQHDQAPGSEVLCKSLRWAGACRFWSTNGASSPGWKR